MKLLSSDEETFDNVAFYYSVITSCVFSFLILLLLHSEFYLLLGSRNIFPLFIFLIIFEILKWYLHVIMFKKDFLSFKRKLIHVLFSYINYGDVGRSFVMLFICCIGFYILTILFGAELLDKQEQTLMFSVLLTLLSVFPISVQFGSSYVESFIRREKPNNIFHTLIYYNSLGAIIGAWFGAFVIPLDWDRPWQVWPIPCALGALIGCCLTNYFYLIKLSISHFGFMRKKQF